jgi:hypothetical protein
METKAHEMKAEIPRVFVQLPRMRILEYLEKGGQVFTKLSSTFMLNNRMSLGHISHC